MLQIFPYSVARKPVVKTLAPMKPLYWNRIQIPPTQEGNDCLWDKLEEEDPNWEEFVNLFSRQVVEKKVPKTVIRSKAKEVAKLLDQKRSQLVGILITSMHLDIAEVENAVYNFDTSVVDLDTLQKIYDARAMPEELKTIKCHVALENNIPLDKPEQFLLQLASIPEFSERVACIMFQEKFSESISNIDNKLNNLKLICEFLMTGQSVQRVLAIILAVGNYMNASNRSRGQADGFGLEILSKLRDVKSKDNSMSLLQYIVRSYIEKFQKDDSLETATFPLVEPADMERASHTCFEDVATDLVKLKAEAGTCKNKVQKVLEASQEHQEPFKDKMETFLDKGHKDLEEQETYLEECKAKFLSTKSFFSWRPKSSKEAEWTHEFFSSWVPFCTDFKNIWKKEFQRKIKLEIEAAKKAAQELAKSKTANVIKCQPTSLKARMAEKGLLKKQP